MTHVTVSLLVVLVVASMAWSAGPAASAAPGGVRMETFTYKKTPQGELKIHVSFPAGWKASDSRAAIVFFFGGGWTGGTVEQFADHAEHLARRGMVAARADYRVASRHKVRPDKCVEDARTAMRWLRGRAGKLGIDPKRLCAAGGSAGGHLAACTQTVEGLDDAADDLKVSCKPNLLVLYNPVLDMSGPRIAGRVGSAATARRISPNLHLTKDLPPAIMFYGSKDRFLEHARAYAAKAKGLKLKVEVFVADGVGHAFFNRPPWKPRTMHLMDRFLARHGYLTGPSGVELPEGKVAMKELSGIAGSE